MNGLLAVAAQACLEGIELARGRMASAEDDVAFERDVRAMSALCRNLRQTIAMKQRFEREELALARVRADEVQAREREARRAHDSAVAAHRERVERHVGRVLWDEYEQDEALELIDEVRDSLDDLAREPGFLQTSAETLIQNLMAQFVVAPREAPGSADLLALAVSTPAESDTAPLPPEPPAPPPREADVGLEVEPPPHPPDPPPPGSPPEPYVPPWERLRPGQSMAGGTGW